MTTGTAFGAKPSARRSADGNPPPAPSPAAKTAVTSQTAKPSGANPTGKSPGADSGPKSPAPSPVAKPDVNTKSPPVASAAKPAAAGTTPKSPAPNPTAKPPKPSATTPGPKPSAASSPPKAAAPSPAGKTPPHSSPPATHVANSQLSTPAAAPIPDPAPVSPQEAPPPAPEASVPSPPSLPSTSPASLQQQQQPSGPDPVLSSSAHASVTPDKGDAAPSSVIATPAAACSQPHVPAPGRAPSTPTPPPAAPPTPSQHEDLPSSSPPSDTPPLLTTTLQPPTEPASQPASTSPVDQPQQPGPPAPCSTPEAQEPAAPPGRLSPALNPPPSSPNAPPDSPSEPLPASVTPPAAPSSSPPAPEPPAPDTTDASSPLPAMEKRSSRSSIGAAADSATPTPTTCPTTSMDTTGTQHTTPSPTMTVPVSTIAVRPAPPPPPPAKSGRSLKAINGGPLRAPAQGETETAASGPDAAVPDGPEREAVPAPDEVTEVEALGDLGSSKPCSRAPSVRCRENSSSGSALTGGPAAPVNPPLARVLHSWNEGPEASPPPAPPPPPPLQQQQGRSTQVEGGGGAAGSVCVVLEGNPGGLGPVEVSLDSLLEGPSGEVLVADLVTAGMKALRTRYGTIRPGPSVSVVYDNPATAERHPLLTFDIVPPDLLVQLARGAVGGARIVLLGITCEGDRTRAEAKSATTASLPTPPQPPVSRQSLPAPVSASSSPPKAADATAPQQRIPLPGTAEGSDSGAAVTAVTPPPPPPQPSTHCRVTFLSQIRNDSEADTDRATPGTGRRSDGGGGGGTTTTTTTTTGADATESEPAFIHTRKLVRGESEINGGGGTGGTAARPAVRILGAGHRSVRLRAEDDAVETLCVESAAPSATSVASTWRGGRLPPLRVSGDGAAAAAGLSAKGRLGATRSSRRLLIKPHDGSGLESVGSSDFAECRTLPSVVRRDPVEVLRSGGSVGPASRAASGVGPVMAAAADAGKGGKDVDDAKARISRAGGGGGGGGGGGVEEGAKDGSPAVGGVGPLFARKDAAGAEEEVEEVDLLFPVPPAEWSMLMGHDPTETGEGDPQPPAGCLACLSSCSSSAKLRQLRDWRNRLRAALMVDGAAEVNAWLVAQARAGRRTQDELDAVLWLAVEARALATVRQLLQGGAQPNAPRPTGLAAPPPAPATQAPQGTSAAKASSHRQVGQKAISSGVPWGAPFTSASSVSVASAALVGLTPLMRATELAAPSLVEVLLAAGADASAIQPGTRWTALHRAILASPPGPCSTTTSIATSVNTTTSSTPAAAAGGITNGGKVLPGGNGSGSSGRTAAGEGDGALHCAQLLLAKVGLPRALRMRTGGRHRDDLLRFAVRHGRSAAVRWLMTAGFAAAAAGEDDEDEGSCAYLAGSLGLTLDVWDLPPPPRRTAAATRRDPARPLSWLSNEEERAFTDQRRQLLMGAAAAGQVDVLAMVLDKPVPYDRLRRDELEAAIGAVRLATPRNQRHVEDLLVRRAHTYLGWEQDLGPALRRLDAGVLREWLLRDRPGPPEVDRALAAVLMTERLGAATWQDAAVAVVQLLLDAGADVECAWQGDPSSVMQYGSRSAGGGRKMRPLLAAILAPSPAVVRHLLAAGADPRRRDVNGENALFVAVRQMIRVTAGPRDALAQVLPSAADTVGIDANAVAAASECLAVLLTSDHASELLTTRNDVGLTPAFLAAVADAPRVLQQLCGAGADSWLTGLPATPGAPDSPRELLLPGGTMTTVAGVWSVGHEVARCGALGGLRVLLLAAAAGAGTTPVQPAGSAAPSGGAGGISAGRSPESAVLAARRREALVGAIRGGRVEVVKMLLDAEVDTSVGGGGGLYESELAAALALCHASAAAAPLPPPPGAAAASSAASSPPRYEALAAFLSSRAHVYMSWEGEVLPALRAGHVMLIHRWITGDRIQPSDATRALCALVESARQCKRSAAAVGSTAAAEYGSGGGGGAGGDAGGLAALSVAAAGGSGRAAAEIATALVRAGADVNYQWPADGSSDSGETAGQTVLMQAASKGHLPLVEVLIALGARMDAEDPAGYTALDLAVLVRQQHGDDGVLAALLAAYGIRRLNSHRTHAGDSALMLAVRACDTAAVQQLLLAGAAPAAADAAAPPPPPPAAAAHPPAPAPTSSHTSNTATSTNAATISNQATLSASGTASSAPAAPPRVLGSSSSLLSRRGSAVYLAARMNDAAMLRQLLRGASTAGESSDLESCRQEAVLGALHGGRLALLEMSLGLPERLRVVVAPPSAGAAEGGSDGGGGGAVSMATAVAQSASLAEQAASRLEEIKVLLRELEVAAAATAAAKGAAGCEGQVSGLQSTGDVAAAVLSDSDVARLRRYLGCKVGAVGAVAAAHQRMATLYGSCRERLDNLEEVVRERREQATAPVRAGADAQVKLMTAQGRLTASREGLVRGVAAAGEAATGRLEVLLERKLAGLAAAGRRAEAQVSSEVESLVLDLRKEVARGLREVEARRGAGMAQLEGLQRKAEVALSRKQRLLAGRPPAQRQAASQRLQALRQQLTAAEEALSGRCTGAVRWLEAQQRRGMGAAGRLEAVRQGLAASQQEAARTARDAAASAKDAVSTRAQELLSADRHDQLHRIVGQMQVQVNRGSAEAATTTTRALAALQQAAAEVEGQLGARVAAARQRMQEHLTAVMEAHLDEVRVLVAAQRTEAGAVEAAGQAGGAPPPPAGEQRRPTGPPGSPPDVGLGLQGLDLVAVLEAAAAGGSGGSPSGVGGEGASDGAQGGASDTRDLLAGVMAVEDAIEDMIADRGEQLRHAFPPDGICDALSPTALQPLLDPDTDLPTAGLGLEAIRTELKDLDLALPPVEPDLASLDLGALTEDDSSGLGSGGGGGVGVYGEEYGSGGGGYQDHQGGRQRKSAEYDNDDNGGGLGRYNAATYANRAEDEFALSYS